MIEMYTTIIRQPKTLIEKALAIFLLPELYFGKHFKCTKNNKITKKSAYYFSLFFVILLSIGNATGQIPTYFTTIAKGSVSGHSLGIKNDGTLWAWGYNNYGELGDGTTVQKNSPAQVGTVTNWVSVSVGNAHSLGITADGKLWAWGFNYYGQLGDGTTTQRNSAVQVGTATNWVSISAGDSHSLGITADGKLWAWGFNGGGQLGDNTSTDRYSPIRVDSATNWVSVSAGDSHSLGITADGKLWGWGDNGTGQLGDSTVLQRYSPVQVGSANNWLNVSAGVGHSLGITAEGKLWTWGSNAYGQLGDNTTTDRYYPIQVGTATNWVGVSTSAYNSFGITADGKQWAWGFNFYGQLGDNTTTDRNKPAQVGTATNWVGVSSGFYHSNGITTDGKFWAWGHNFFGQLGDGTTADKKIPLQIPGQITIATGLASTGSFATMQQGQYNIFISSSNFIASVSSTRASLTPITGEVTAKVWIEASQPAQYVNRHYEITPVNNAGTATGRITLYFLQAEFDAFNAVNSIKLPTSSSDATGIANLLIEKRSGVSSDGSGLPNTYPTTTTPKTINPVDADIIWNTLLNRWEVSFDVKGFSGFFVKTSSFVLPLKLLSFAGSKVNGTNHLVWTTTNEINTREFNIEWSTDAQLWKTLGTITATGNNNNNIYNYNHNNAPTGKNFYKLKMVDQDGHFTYSNIIFLNSGDNTRLVIYPNPVKDMLTIYAGNNFLNTMVSLNNMEGKLLQRTLITSNQQNINVQLLPKGMYVLNFEDGSAQKFIKQ